VIGKRMFTTYLFKDNTANILLPPKEQSIFCKMDAKNIYPVPNKWSAKDATTFELNRVSKEFLLKALVSAYNQIIKLKNRIFLEITVWNRNWPLSMFYR
jgi:hypothetical protein